MRWSPRFMYALWVDATAHSDAGDFGLLLHLPHAFLQVFAACCFFHRSVHGSALISVALASLFVGYIQVGLLRFYTTCLDELARLTRRATEPSTAAQHGRARANRARRLRNVRRTAMLTKVLLILATVGCALVVP